MFSKKPVGKNAKFTVNEAAEQRKSSILARITARKQKAEIKAAASDSSSDSSDSEPEVALGDTYKEPEPIPEIKQEAPEPLKKKEKRASRSSKKQTLGEQKAEGSGGLSREDAEELLRKAQRADELKAKRAARAKAARDSRREIQRLDFERRAREFVKSEQDQATKKQETDDVRIKQMAVDLAKRIIQEQAINHKPKQAAEVETPGVSSTPETPHVSFAPTRRRFKIVR